MHVCTFGVLGGGSVATLITGAGTGSVSLGSSYVKAGSTVFTVGVCTTAFSVISGGFDVVTTCNT